MPATKLQHGCYSLRSAFSIIQHAHAGAPMGYIEALEVADAPDGKHRIVLCHYNGNRGHYRFVEFESVEDTVREVNRLQWGSRAATDEEFYASRDGFVRFVALEENQAPWFYAEDVTNVTSDCDFVIET